MPNEEYKLSHIKLKMRKWWRPSQLLAMAATLIGSATFDSRVIYAYAAFILITVISEIVIFKCPACKSAVGANSHYCSRCGNKLDDEMVV